MTPIGTETLTTRTPAQRTADAVSTIGEQVERLVASSRRNFQNPYQIDEWPETVDVEADWFFSPELSSVHGTEAWDRLDDAGRRRLTFWEAVSFFSLNIHGERDLLRGLAARLYRPDLVEVAPYLHHFIDEENKHSLYFGSFCERYGKIYRSRQLAGHEGEAGPQDDLRFFAKVLIFEEIVDRFNVHQARDGRLHPVARFINQNHHLEETRHLIFGRRIVEALWVAHSPTWSDDEIEGLRRYLAQFFVTTWREYYNPDVYADAGLDDPWGLAEELWAAESQRHRRRALSERCTRVLIDCGLLREEPHAAH